MSIFASEKYGENELVQNESVTISFLAKQNIYTKRFSW